MNELIERAIDRVDDLDAIINGRYEKPVLVNAHLEGGDSRNQISPYGVSEQVLGGCKAAISAIFEALRSLRGQIHPRVSSRPPEWWADVRRTAEHQGLPPSSAKTALVDALAILDRHVRDDTPHLIGLALLVNDLHLKIKAMQTPDVFRSTGNPNTHKIVYVFDPEIDGDADGSVKEALHKRAFVGQPCSAFLRDALEELETLR